MVILWWVGGGFEVLRVELGLLACFKLMEYHGGIVLYG